MDAETVTPPKPPHPKDVAKGAKSFLKGRPKWQYIAGITVIIGVAYMVWRRQSQAVDTSATDGTVAGTTGADSTGYVGDGPAAAGDLGGGYVFAPPTQGAFGGGDTPIPTTDPAPSGVPPVSITFNDAPGGQLSTLPLVVPGPGPAPAATVPAHGTGPVTGGGPPNRPSAGHQTQAPAAQLVAIPPGKVEGYKGVNQADGPRQGRRYKVVYRNHKSGTKTVKWIYHDYESKSGKGDYGRLESDRIAMGPA